MNDYTREMLFFGNYFSTPNFNNFYNLCTEIPANIIQC